MKSTPRGLRLYDERGRRMDFPQRQDYVSHLREHGFIRTERDFVGDDNLTQAVYLDWLRRSQVGCVFAQLLARPTFRTGIRTVTVRSPSDLNEAGELAEQIARLVEESVEEPSVEALSILLPNVRESEALARLVWALGNQPNWSIEQEQLWRGTLRLIGLRVAIADDVVSEPLGMGPFSIFPATRQCPLTTLEVRTKTTRTRRSQYSSEHLATHLADLPTGHMLTPEEHGVRFSIFTPRLKKRVLGRESDARAKAGVTFSVPAAIWAFLREDTS